MPGENPPPISPFPIPTFGARLFVINFVAVKCNCICSHASKLAHRKKKETNGSEAGKHFSQWSSPIFPLYLGFPCRFPIASTEVISIFDGVFRLNNFWCEFPPNNPSKIAKSGNCNWIWTHWVNRGASSRSGS